MTRSELVLAAVIAVIASTSASVVAAHVARSVRRVDSLETRSLTIIDTKNRPIAALSSSHDSPEFALFDQQHRKRAALFLENNGTPDLYLYDAAGKARAALDLYDSGVPNLELLGDSGGANGPNVLLESTGAGQFRLAFHDFRKKGATLVGRLEFHMVDGEPSLELIDDSGKILWRTPPRATSN